MLEIIKIKEYNQSPMQNPHKKETTSFFMIEYSRTHRALMNDIELNEENLWNYLQQSSDHTKIYSQDKSVWIEKFSISNEPIVVEVWGNDEDEDYDVSINSRGDLDQVVYEFQRLGGTLSDINKGME